MRRGGRPGVAECRDDRQTPAYTEATGIEVLGRPDAFHCLGAGAAVQLLSLPGAQGGDPGQSRARPAQSSQGDVVSQDQSDAAPGKQTRGRRGAPEGVQDSDPAVVDGRA